MSPRRPDAPARTARLSPPSLVAATVLSATLLSAAAAVRAQDGVSVELRDAGGAVVGEATLRSTPAGVHIDARFTALPAGTHGFHLHESGRCDPADGFESAGGHLAGDREHGFLVEGGPHPGDMPNIHVPESGELRVEVINARVTLDAEGDGALLDADGSALMIHSGADDYESQPSGDAGSRIACGEIVGG